MLEEVKKLNLDTVTLGQCDYLYKYKSIYVLYHSGKLLEFLAENHNY